MLVGHEAPAGWLIVQSGPTLGSYDLPPTRFPQVAAHHYLTSCRAPAFLVYLDFLYWSPLIGPMIFLWTLQRSVVVLKISFARVC